MLDTLTPEQEARFSAYREKWLKIGLDTSPIDKEEATQAIHLLYQCGGLAPPAEIHFYRSPFELAQKVKAVDISNFLYGQHEAAWLAFYDFFMQETTIDTVMVQKKTCRPESRSKYLWMATTV